VAQAFTDPVMNRVFVKIAAGVISPRKLVADLGDGREAQAQNWADALRLLSSTDSSAARPTFFS
jgi:hypothetical protein